MSDFVAEANVRKTWRKSNKMKCVTIYINTISKIENDEREIGARTDKGWKKVDSQTLKLPTDEKALDKLNILFF